ncbi:hypothetical protein C3Z06_17635 [Cupriavidus metallidurans]|nr:hypothetical protein C3Z06_17635 [Cupriavidus metallidurans]
MTRATASIPLRGALLLIIVLAQLLTPLLHGHIGTPNQTGLHVHTSPSRSFDSESLSGHGDHHRHAFGSHREPFEVDVETAIGPLSFSLLLQAAAVLGASVLTFVLLAALAVYITPRRAWRPASPRGRWSSRVGWPPPAQAPPIFS